MSVPTEISSEERDALYDQILNHLSGLDDLRMAFENGDFDQAARLGVEFGDELRLLEDLGWGHGLAGCAFPLTMGPGQLRRVLTRLRSDAEGLRRDEEREKAALETETRDRLRRATRVTEACDRVLDVIERALAPQARDELD